MRREEALQLVAPEDPDLPADLRYQGDVHVRSLPLADVLVRVRAYDVLLAGQEGESSDSVPSLRRRLERAIYYAVVPRAGDV